MSNDNVRSIETNQLIKNIILSGYWIMTEDEDGETKMCSTFKEVTKIADNLDQVSLQVIQRTTNRKMGTFYLSFWNKGIEQISDYSASYPCEGIYEAVAKRGQELREEIINKYGNL